MVEVSSVGETRTRSLPSIITRPLGSLNSRCAGVPISFTTAEGSVTSGISTLSASSPCRLTLASV